MNDRALRQMTAGLGGAGNGYPREEGFDIVVASEVMAIFCLAVSIEDLKTRLAKIVIGYTKDKKPVTAKDLNAHGAMTVLLKDALAPNLVQTLENNPAFVHGGPFANIAHGCNSVIATQSALKLADYVVTEAGFGADLGAEKFIDIKCRQSGLRPSAAVIVVTVRSVKYHGGAELNTLTQEDLSTLERGLVNLERHVENITQVYNLPCVVSINQFSSDTDAEIDLIRQKMAGLGVQMVVSSHWAHGGRGAAELAEVVVQLCEREVPMTYVYEDEDTLWEKVNKIARKVYRASDVTAENKVHEQIQALQNQGYGHFPVCIAKTQSSFSTDPKSRGAPLNHTVNIREVRLSAGAGFIVMICGDIMTMPGLPKVPAAEKIDYVDGRVIGLF
jgi:formate--tetrahydrofolate ligase